MSGRRRAAAIGCVLAVVVVLGAVALVVAVLYVVVLVGAFALATPA